MYQVLICDDEQDIINALKIYLAGPGHGRHFGHGEDPGAQQRADHPADPDRRRV